MTPLEQVARVAADGDPDTRRVMAFHEQWRADGYREVLKLLGAKAELRPGIDLDRATDLLLLCVGMDVYHALVDGRGWSQGLGRMGRIDGRRRCLDDIPRAPSLEDHRAASAPPGLLSPRA